MSDVVGDWKRFQMTQHGVHWQQDYFDHRLRSDERGEQLAVKFDYIRRNPRRSRSLRAGRRLAVGNRLVDGLIGWRCRDSCLGRACGAYFTNARGARVPPERARWIETSGLDAKMGAAIALNNSVPAFTLSTRSE